MIMDLDKVTVNKNNLLAKDDLMNFSQEELINKILQLQSHNQQLKNIIAKRDNAENKHNNKEREFDFSRYKKQHILLKILYLGWNYQGFVCQEDTANTVEHNLIEALLKCRLIESRQTSNYHRCGRTDKGVSSFGQVISITVRAAEDGKPSLQYCKMLNRLLPEDIRAIAWCPVNDQVSARFDCTNRTYRYYFPKGKLNLDLMNQAAQYLIGTHDFRNFCKMDVLNGVTNFIRCITSVNIKEINKTNDEGYEMCKLELSGSAFLWHQVRCIVSVLFLVGQKLEEPNIVLELLNIDANPEKPQYPLADPYGLNLYSTEYAFSNWIIDESEISNITSILQKQWAEFEIKATHLKEMIDDLKVHLQEPVFNQNSFLVKREGKQYKPLLERHRCKSLEDKIEHYRKRRKIIVTEIEN